MTESMWIVVSNGDKWLLLYEHTHGEWKGGCRWAEC